MFHHRHVTAPILMLLVALAGLSPTVRAQATVDYSGKLFEVGGTANDRFGSAIAASPTHLLIGATGDAVSGSIFAYQLVGGAWTLQQVFGSANSTGSDEFGYDCAIDGTTLVVGARYYNDPVIDTGAAFVFEYANGLWTETTKLPAIGLSLVNELGTSVAISGDLIVSGAPNFGQGAFNGGGVFVFELLENWTHVEVLKPSTIDSFDLFGQDVATDGSRIFTGMPGEEVGGTPMGVVFVHEKIAGAWAISQQIPNPAGAAGDDFGWQIDLDNERLFVGIPNQLGTGTVAIFSETASGWTLDQLLQPTKAEPLDQFGWSLDASGDHLVVGAPGTQGNRGAAYHYHHDGTAWVEVLQVLGDLPPGIFDTKLGTACGLVGKTGFGGSTLDIGGGAPTALPFGATYEFVLSDIGLDAVPDSVPPLGQLTIETHGGLAGAAMGTFAVDVSGVPISPLLLFVQGNFDAEGKHTITFPVPSSLSGLSLTMLGAGFWQTGKVGFSELVVASFQ